MYERKRVFVYDFATNVVPGQGEKERGYWRDVGSLDAYYQANMDLVDVDPVFSLYNDRWPIYTDPAQLPAGEVRLQRTRRRAASGTPPTRSSREGCIISGGHVHRCILSPKVRINSYARWRTRSCSRT